MKVYTKIYAMAGLRLGYLLCHDKNLLSRIGEYGAEWSVSVIAQESGIAALSEADWIAQTRKLINEERDYLIKEFLNLGLTVFPSDANFLLLKSEIPLYESLKNKGILVRNCNNFYGLDEHFIRIGIQTHEKNKELIASISEVI